MITKFDDIFKKMNSIFFKHWNFVSKEIFSKKVNVSYLL
jgi:hypothetical protein